MNCTSCHWSDQWTLSRLDSYPSAVDIWSDPDLDRSIDSRSLLMVYAQKKIGRFTFLVRWVKMTLPARLFCFLGRARRSRDGLMESCRSTRDHCHDPRPPYPETPVPPTRDLPWDPPTLDPADPDITWSHGGGRAQPLRWRSVLVVSCRVRRR